MGFIGEIGKIIGAELAKGEFTMMMVGGDKLYMDGVTRLLTIANEEIVVLAKKTQIGVRGHHLVVLQSSVDSIVLGGQIESVDFVHTKTKADKAGQKH